MTKIVDHLNADFTQLSLFEKLALTRLSEEAIIADYSKDEIKTPVHLGIGSEAIAVGTTAVFPKDTTYFGTYRNHNLYLCVSNDINGFFAELYGKTTGTQKGIAGSMHLAHPDFGLIMTSAVVASTIPIALGAALASKLSGKNNLVAVYFGDGALEEGVFSESLNFASLHKLPIVFICEDNGLAIHTPQNQRTGYKSLESLCSAYDIGYFQADAHHVQNIIDSTKQAIEFLNTHTKPVMLHANYFRFLQHVGTNEDFADGYRSKPKDIHALDPYLNFISFLKQQSISQNEIQNVILKVKDRISVAIVAAQKAPYPSKHDLYTNVFTSELPIQ